jgi:Ca-activated chloride channel family protein
MEQNNYKLLGIPVDASQEEIRFAYHETARRVHPDANQDNPEAAEQFLAVQQAYDVLSDPVRRSQYNDTLPPSLLVPPLHAHTLYSRANLTFSREKQMFYALARLSPQSAEMVNVNPSLNICLVVDCSTSMGGLLLDTVKATAIQIVRQIRPDDIFSIVSFSDRADVVVPASEHQNRRAIESSIRLLKAKGGTEIFQGLEAGYREVLRHRDPKHVNHIILITDGRTYGDEEACLELAEKAGAKQIGISGLGIGGKWNDNFLDSVAAKSGGNTMFVTRTKDVETFLQEKVNRLGMSYADQLRFEFESDEGIELRAAFRLQPETAPLEVTSPIMLGGLPRNGMIEVIFEFLVNPISEKTGKIYLAKGRLYFDMANRPALSNSIRLDLEREIRLEPDPLTSPAAIVQAMSNLTLYRIQEKARKAVQDGDVSEATRLLQNVATNLFSQGQGELAHVVLKEASHVERTSGYSDDGDKRIKYGTRSLLLPSSASENNL